MDDRSSTAVRRTIGIDVGGTKTLGVLVERGPDGVVVVDREQTPSDAGRPEAVGRLIPGVVGNPASLVEESHEDGLLEYPSYTKPASWRGRDVPEVLLSGDHAKIAAWRHEQGLQRTRERRPDLLD